MAPAYADNYWNRLTRFVDDPQAGIDNNPAGDGDRHVAVARSGWLGQIVPKRGSELDNRRPRSSADTYGSWARVCSGRVRERASRRGLAPRQKGRSKRACLRGMPTQDYNLWSCLRVN